MWRIPAASSRLVKLASCTVGTFVSFRTVAIIPSYLPTQLVQSWVKLERWNALSQQQRTKFAPIAPDFVVELRSKSDTLKDLQDKMQQYMDNGVRLGWLIDRKQRRVYIYRPGVLVQQLDNPETVSADPELKGFVLKLGQIW